MSTVLRHPDGEMFLVGSCAPDDQERMDCDRAGELGHSGCGVHACCGWPNFLLCPCEVAA